MIEAILQRIRDWWWGIPLGAARSPGWLVFKRNYEKTHPKKCPICENTKCDLHHKRAFQSNPELETNEENVVWLCNGIGTLQHHRGVGHLGNFQSINENIDEDIKVLRDKFINRPKFENGKWNYPKVAMKINFRCDLAAN